MRIHLRVLGTVLAMLTAMAAAMGGEAAETALRVNAFPGIANLPIFAAQRNGFFAQRGLKVELEFTPSSQAQREGLAQGRFDIGHTGVDNAVALVELAKVDAIIVTGLNGLRNELIVQPGIRSYADLRGKTVIVDAPNTAFALVLYKMLQLNGLRKEDYAVKPIGATALRLEAMRKDRSYAASMLNVPFSVAATKEGFRSLGLATDVIGPYQDTGTMVLRAWAQANADTLVRYIQAYVAGLRWAMNPANKAELVGLMVERLKLSPDVAARSWELEADPVNGFAKDARFDLEGFKNLLRLRAELAGQWVGTPPAPDIYFDLSYYERALAGL